MTSQNKALRIALLLLRIGLAGVFIFAAWIKLREPWMLFAISIDNYHILPEWGVNLVARTLPWLELAIGLLLLSGFWMRISTVATSALLALFFGMMVRAYVHGEAIDCGCFGPGEAISPLTLLRDGSLLAGSLLLTVIAFRRPRKPAPPLAAENLAESSYRPA